MRYNKCFICHKVECQTDKHSRPGNKTKIRSPFASPSSFIRATVVSEASPLLDYTRKLNISEKEAISSLGIVYRELDQDGSPIESQSSEMVAFLAEDF